MRILLRVLVLPVLAAACSFSAPAQKSVAFAFDDSPRDTGAAHGVQSAGANGWISHPAASAEQRPLVLHFQRSVDLTAKPDAYRVRVSADNNFILFVNGLRVASGPSTSDSANWRYSQIDLGPFLQAGRNVVAATVWNYVRPPLPMPVNASEAERHQAWGKEMMNQTGRLAQQSLATGFWLEGEGDAAAIGTAREGWSVALDPGRSALSGIMQLDFKNYYVASSPETIDLRTAIQMHDPAPAIAADWQAAVAAPAAALRELSADPLPAQRFELVPSGKVVRASFDAGMGFPARKVSIPANSRQTLLIRRDAMVAGYPELLLSGGRDARIRLTYGEAMYDEAGHKGDRKAFAGRHIEGISDEIIADGAVRSVLPLWWRVWHFLEIEVQTGATPLTLEGLQTWETGYPFTRHGYFRSSDPELDRIWQIGWRTALIDAHDTYMDSSYWEQLQYVGDTRLQMLISYAVSGDPRLAIQALDAFAHSNVDDGLIEGAWPSRGTNSIATFSLLWIGMLHDWWYEQPDAAVVIRNLPRMRQVLRWFADWQSESGLLKKNPQWNFVDWVGQPPTDRTVFPSYGKDEQSCLTSMIYLGALQQAAAMEFALGDLTSAQENRSQATALGTALREHCYSADRKLYADNPDQDVFSQHVNVLAVLYDVVAAEDAQDLLKRIVAPGKGIDAPAGMYPSSYYFSWYLVRAFEHAGLANSYFDLLQTWRDLLKLNFTSWPEERGETRSDSHAWSAHPTADLLRIVAGIGPGEPGYQTLRVAPVLGNLSTLDAAAMTPQGLVSVSYRRQGDRLTATISKPTELPGWFELEGRKYKLSGAKTELRLTLK